MSKVFGKIFSSIGAFFGKKKNRRISYLVLICLIALGEFLLSGLVRRTFVFYSYLKGETVVEDRMLRLSNDRETDIRRYIEEVLLGPVSPDLAPLFPRETRLFSFMYREGLVYADLTEAAALPFQDVDSGRFPGIGGGFPPEPVTEDEASLAVSRGPPEKGEVFRNLLTLNEGIRRNFPYVKDVRLFIGGNEVFFEEFRGIFANSADNRKTAP